MAERTRFEACTPDADGRCNQGHDHDCDTHTEDAILAAVDVPPGTAAVMLVGAHAEELLMQIYLSGFGSGVASLGASLGMPEPLADATASSFTRSISEDPLHVEECLTLIRSCLLDHAKVVDDGKGKAGE